MKHKTRWETRKIQCPEEKRNAKLFIEWHLSDGTEKVNSVRCDNPKLADLDNWDCCWTCWEKIEGK